MLHDFTCDVTCMSLMIQAQMFQSKYLKIQARNEKDVGGVFTPPPQQARTYLWLIIDVWKYFVELSELIFKSSLFWRLLAIKIE